MVINQKTIEQNTYEFLKILFALPEIKKVAIKDIVIASIDDSENINLGLSKCYHDQLSDVDFSIWISLNPIDFNKASPIYKTYFSRLQLSNQIFGIIFQERDENNKEGMRVVLNSGYRMDISCYITCDENSCQLSSSFEPDIVEYKSNEFWFITIQTLAKLLRRDHLIADHLSHMLIMEGLVLQMIERDEQHKTNFHRYGYSEELLFLKSDISRYNRFLSTEDETYNHIATTLCKAVASYDHLMCRCNSIYYSHIDTFFEIWDSYINVSH